ncbi:hypothetical protein M0R45_032685 [Rubus argutus]|uniref:Uncharacterized protein n=1 Tax=Rubus argutus TaxID=59490 RepID=A0AAW1WHV9_RUBAR
MFPSSHHHHLSTASVPSQTVATLLRRCIDPPNYSVAAITTMPLLAQPQASLPHNHQSQAAPCFHITITSPPSAIKLPSRRSQFASPAEPISDCPAVGFLIDAAGIIISTEPPPLSRDPHLSDNRRRRRYPESSCSLPLPLHHEAPSGHLYRLESYHHQPLLLTPRRRRRRTQTTPVMQKLPPCLCSLLVCREE